MRKVMLLAGLFILLTSLALAQTKISGSLKCGKDTAEHMLPVGDNPNHSFGLTQGNCTWTKAWKIDGVAAKGGTGTATVDTNGDVSKSSGVYVDDMENGDKAIYHYSFTATKKGDQAQISGHHWQLVSGTGKLKGVKGQGTCKATPTADGGADYECMGTYTKAAK
jgi:hypothetical protein